MDDRYAIINQTLPHFITITVVDWVDVFSRKVYRDEVITRYLRNNAIKLRIFKYPFCHSDFYDKTKFFW